MPPENLVSILNQLRHAADTGQHLGAITAPRIAAHLGMDTLTVDTVAADGSLELMWCCPAAGLGPDLGNLQYALGDGPTLEAVRLGLTVIEPDLAAADPARWPLFLSAAADTAVRAVIAAPLRLGIATVGALTSYRTTPGPLTDTQLRDFHRVRRGLLPLLLQSAQGLSATGPGDGLHLYRAEVHQAAGFLSSRLAIPLDQALARLRAYAISHDIPLIDLAHETLADQRRLDDPRP
ncbi:GAF and ANTAR domain-containing protein [Amycolatopsis japonica]|uniref:GAF and ANTAR domain-containing protein n=1 Tax=Amycolatopsis japonica TaxID=208439 RepID=UPI003401EA31